MGIRGVELKEAADSVAIGPYNGTDCLHFDVLAFISLHIFSFVLFLFTHIPLTDKDVVNVIKFIFVKHNEI